MSLFAHPLSAEAIGLSATFVIYAITGLVSFVFIVGFVPETKGRRLGQIQDIMRRPARENFC